MAGMPANISHLSLSSKTFVRIGRSPGVSRVFYTDFQ
jgi:hypothetical protein